MTSDTPVAVADNSDSPADTSVTAVDNSDSLVSDISVIVFDNSDGLVSDISLVLESCSLFISEISLEIDIFVDNVLEISLVKDDDSGVVLSALFLVEVGSSVNVFDKSSVL